MVMEKQIRVCWIVITIGWVVAFVIWGISWAIHSPYVAVLSVLVATGTTCMTMREFFMAHDRTVRNIIRVLRLGEDVDASDKDHLRRMR